VHTPGNAYPAGTCEMAGSLWGNNGTCELVDVNGRQVGLTTGASGQFNEFEQWAGYRHPDGTVVLVAQARQYRGAASPLPQPVFTPRQLAELATADRFHLG